MGNSTTHCGQRGNFGRATCPASEPRQPADVEASIPSAAGTQLMMSHMLSPTTKQCPIMWDTGSIVRRHWSNQIIESHPKKTLVRAWCGPGAGLLRAWRGPRFQGHPRTVTRTCGNLRRRGVGASNALMAGVRTE